jgi:serine protease Do
VIPVPMQQPTPAPRPAPGQTPAPKMAGQGNQAVPVQPLNTPPSPRAYNLDELVSDRSKAEADLEGMISEMRGRMKER